MDTLTLLSLRAREASRAHIYSSTSTLLIISNTVITSYHTSYHSNKSTRMRDTLFRRTIIFPTDTGSAGTPSSSEHPRGLPHDPPTRNCPQSPHCHSLQLRGQQSTRSVPARGPRDFHQIPNPIRWANGFIPELEHHATVASQKNPFHRVQEGETTSPGGHTYGQTKTG